MHPSALNNAKDFFGTYSNYLPKYDPIRVVEIGSQDINGGLRSLCPNHFEYIGVDFQAGNGVDVVLLDPYSLPFEDDTVDIVLTSSCLEHSEMFWLVILEVLRVLKPHGLLLLNVPSQGTYHQYPVDCWRFYPDSGIALSKWGNHMGFNSRLLESYTQIGGGWGDFVAVILKNSSYVDRYPRRILDKKKDYINGRRDDYADIILNCSQSNNNETLVLFLNRLLPKALRSIIRSFYERFSTH